MFLPQLQDVAGEVALMKTLQKQYGLKILIGTTECIVCAWALKSTCEHCIINYIASFNKKIFLCSCL